MSSPRSAFTLVELLVVIAIVSLLASMLLPAVRTVGEAVKQTRCQGNQRQMMQAIIAYAGDHNGWTPYAEGGTTTGPLGPSRRAHVALLVGDYLPRALASAIGTVGICENDFADLRTPSVLVCPSATLTTASSWFYTVRWFTDAMPGVVDDGLSGRKGGSIPLVRLDATMPYLAETIYRTYPLSSGPYWWNCDPTASTRNYIAVNRLHRGRAVVAWKDGRAAARNLAGLAEDHVINIW